MQLAKPLKQPPREIAARLIAVAAAPVGGAALGRIDRHRRARLHQPAPEGRGAPVGRRRDPRRRRRLRPRAGDTANAIVVEFVSANPTGPLHVGHGRQAALGDSICNLFETQGWRSRASSTTTTPACRSRRSPASVQARLRGLKPGDAELARGGLQRRLHRRHRRRLRWPEDGQADDRELHRVGRRRRPRRHPPVRGRLPAPRAGPRPAGLRRALRPLLPRVEPLLERPRRRARCSA